ncbi:hypothetical protein GJ654_16915 [Rhodoblastus acidophilus]|uniref:Intracellular septation protein A n=1 Tax=Rhodoblastus acidophilus TaxID=1074 RepID=A0A6N8DQV1_RHOAC|nr:hypothetical protein [Rhodoblastus acidophilus]MCW2273774.1 hypothetical protein [Rhodoblastus acidophilus]MTV32668.1 hypothetical protein [Rhodoblastus acidophilus]
MSLIKMLVSFAPWIAFLILARGDLLQIKIALLVAFVVNVGMAVTKLHRGALMWAGNVFFLVALVAVGWFENLWVLRNLGVLANGALAAGVLGGLLAGKPFTLEYAKQSVDPGRWSDPVFVRTNTILTGVWGATFVVNAALAWAKTRHELLPDDAFEVLNYAGLIGAALFTRWYAAFMHRKADAARRPS